MKTTQHSGSITFAKGFLAQGVSCGIKKTDKSDLAIIYSETPATVAGVFTQNQIKAAPVVLTSKRTAVGSARAIVVNSGNANSCTGKRGMTDAEKMSSLIGHHLGLPDKEVLVASTGVIGRFMPMDKVAKGIEAASRSLSVEGGEEAARAICTTDTFVKEFSMTINLDGKSVRLGGMAKGAGMIHPNMATLLAFITTDASVAPDVLKKMLAIAVDQSFHCITVDGDCSTNDMVLVMANGRAGNRPIKSALGEGQKLQDALSLVCQELARRVVLDGEGATKFIQVKVMGAPDFGSAREAAMAICKSSLFKTAMFGMDANWGRILCALGNAPVKFNPEKVDISFGGLKVAKGGCAVEFSEAKALGLLKRKEVEVEVNLNSGKGEATVFTSDLSYDYVKINASYRS
ncbi:MAG: bifunctional glutamate N-acetyltransferase/amino-acid acetyltransferase ArgJ [candidate division FCPU426 bacterium]